MLKEQCHLSVTPQTTRVIETHSKHTHKYDDFGQQERTDTVIDLGFKRFPTQKTHGDQMS